MEPIVRLLEEAGPAWTRAAPADPTAIARVEDELGLRLPNDYRALLQHSNGGELRRAGVPGLVLEPVERLVWHNEDPAFRRRLPGMFVFANDGAGHAYYYDPEGELGLGPFHILFVAFSSLGFDRSMAVAPSLTGVVRRILTEDDFLEDRKLGRTT
jgi:hypothetical protein